VLGRERADEIIAKLRGVADVKDMAEVARLLVK